MNMIHHRQIMNEEISLPGSPTNLFQDNQKPLQYLHHEGITIFHIRKT